MTRPLRHLPFLGAGIVASLVLLARALAGDAPWVPDLGNGEYRNPILYADYSDPDAIRVGDDYWLISSSFNHLPGLPVLHSRDLVNWELVNHALPSLVPADHYRTVRHGGGVWAPAIRFHANRYWIYYPDPDFGIYLVTATDPRGQWSDPVLVKAGKGFIDPCPFWDDDGQLYLIHAWARSRGPVSNRLSLVKLNADGTKPLDEEVDIIDANKLEGWRTLEGPKLYKRGGFYYVFAPAGGVKEGYQAVFRAKNIYGPYENRIVMDQGGTPINGPHQGAWVDTPTGQDWFLHFQDCGPYGRVVHLQPMAWRADGWPAMGTAVRNGVEKGAPVLTYAKPRITAASQPPSTVPIAEPATTDEFNLPQLGLQWQWHANPAPDWYSLTAHPGCLRLNAVAQATHDLYDTPNLLTQKFPGPAFVATTLLDASNLAVGDEAGLVVFGYRYAWIGVRHTKQGPKLVCAFNAEHNLPGEPAHTTFATEATRALRSPRVYLRVAVDANAACTFSYSTDGASYHPLEDTPRFVASVARWVGATVGVFAIHPSPVATSKAGFADFDWFSVEGNR